MTTGFKKGDRGVVMEKPVSEMSIDELIQTNKHMEKLAHSIIQHLLGNKKMYISDWDKLRRDSEK